MQAGFKPGKKMDVNERSVASQVSAGLLTFWGVE